jgi:hypothetical protein
MSACGIVNMYASKKRPGKMRKRNTTRVRRTRKRAFKCG